MDKRLYKLMNWPKIEAIVYSEEDHPEELLGIHRVTGGNLVQCFRPDAEELTFVDGTNHKEYPMEKVDEDGFFAALLPATVGKEYCYRMKPAEDAKEEISFADPYAFPVKVTESECKAFHAGTNVNLHKLLGARPVTVGNVEGVQFVVWAPNALRVSVVGDFNGRDGRIHPMMRLEDSSLFGLFIPNLKAGETYQYEVKLKDSTYFLKADPMELAHVNVLTEGSVISHESSVICEDSAFSFDDEAYMATRKKNAKKNATKALSILKVRIADYCGKEGIADYKALAASLKEKLAVTKFNALRLHGLLEYPKADTQADTAFGYFAPTSRFGNADAFRAFMNEMHLAGIPVFVDYPISGFMKIRYGLSSFDGSALYESADSLMALNCECDAFLFDFSKPEVRSFVMSSLFYLADTFHVDGFFYDRLDGVLYYDHCREGIHATNGYGGVENFESIDFLRTMNEALHKKYPGLVTIAAEKRGFPYVSTKPSVSEAVEAGLGFDLKTDYGLNESLESYITTDPLYRSGLQKNLSESMLYHYCENFVNSLTPATGASDYLERIPGFEFEKESNLRSLIAYYMLLPGKKEMDASFLQLGEQWGTFLASLNDLYFKNEALGAFGGKEESFEVVDDFHAEMNLFSFVRKTKNQELFVVLHLGNVMRRGQVITVAKPGKYKEIFNTDAECFGGLGEVNGRKKTSAVVKGNETIKSTLAPLSVSVYAYEK